MEKFQKIPGIFPEKKADNFSEDKGYAIRPPLAENVSSKKMVFDKVNCLKYLNIMLIHFLLILFHKPIS